MSDHREFENKVKGVLSSYELDEDTQTQLDLARQRAMQELSNKRSRHWVPYAAAASVASLALVITYLASPAMQTSPDGESIAEDIELLMVEENFEMIEDMEFFQWMSVATDES